MKNINIWYANIFQIDFIYKTPVKNVYKFPHIKNISINICSKSVLDNPKNIIYILLVLKLITNQKPSTCRLRKSVSGFKLRKGMLIGSKVNLSKANPYYENFFYILIVYVFPNLDQAKLKLARFNNKNSIATYIDDFLMFPQISCWYDKFPKNMSGTINFAMMNNKNKFTKVLFSALQIPL